MPTADEAEKTFTRQRKQFALLIQHLLALSFFFFFTFSFLFINFIIMPILEVYSAIAPKDLKSFIKRLSAVFAEQIGKPESVSE